MPAASTVDLLTLHAVRIKGLVDDRAVAERFDLDQSEVSDLLLDFQAYGWITRVDFDGTGGWTLTEAGRDRNQRQLAAELSATGTRGAVRAAHHAFRPRNARLQRACTDWQLRPTARDPLAANDHFDASWDREVLEKLDVIDAELADIVADLSAALTRFHGYDERFNEALVRVQSGEEAWVSGVGVDSCHTIWMELHEDLLASLGLERGVDS